MGESFPRKSPVMTDGIAFERSVAWAAGAGNPAALAELWRRHDGFVRAVVRPLAPTEADAEDWVQDTWCAALRGLSRYRGAASVRTWLYRVAANQARQGLRVNRRQQRLPGVAEPADSALADHPARCPVIWPPPWPGWRPASERFSSCTRQGYPAYRGRGGTGISANGRD